MGRSTASKVAVQGHQAKTEKTSLKRAVNYTVEAMEQRVMLDVKAVVPPWIEQGPASLTSATATSIPVQNSPAGGAVNAIATPPNNSNIVFLGTVNGGVWRSTNAASLNPLWVPMNLGTMSVGAVAISHFDADGNKITATTPVASLPLNKVVVYAAAGRFSSGYSYGSGRYGVYKSNDGGKTWISLDTQLQGLDILAVVPSQSDANTVLVAARSSRSRRGGVYVSTDGGKSFNHVLKKDVTALISDASNTNRFYAAVPKEGIYRTDSNGQAGTWNLKNTGLDVILNDGVDDDRDGIAGTALAPEPDESVAGSTRIDMAMHNSVGGDIVYCELIGSNRRAMGVYRSADGGDHWTLIPNLPDLNPGGQGDTHGALVADPTDPGVVYVSGDRIAGGAVATVWRVDVTPNVTPWEQIVLTGADPDGPGGPIQPTAPHADSRDMEFNSAGQILYASDGGIYRLNNPSTAASRTWDSQNSNLDATEFWSVAYDSLNKTLFGGLQDNGVVEQPKTGALPNQWTGNPIGDGTIVQVVNSGTASTHYYAGQYFSNFQSKVFNSSGVQVGTTNRPALTVVGTGGLKLNGTLLPSTNRAFDPNIQFITRYAVNQQNPQQILIGSGSLYESFDGGATVVPLNPLNDLRANGVDEDGDGLGLGATSDPNEWSAKYAIGAVSAVVYGGNSTTTGADRDLAYVATTAGKLYVRTAINTSGTNVRTSPTFADFTPTAFGTPQVKVESSRTSLLIPTNTATAMPLTIREMFSISRTPGPPRQTGSGSMERIPRPVSAER